jgi:hypothetical protein
MMYFFPVAIAFALLVQGSAFVARPLRPSSKASLKMAVIDPDFPGQTAPFGFFDPLGLSKGASDEDVKRWRESELKHGRSDLLSTSHHPSNLSPHSSSFPSSPPRLAMIAALGIIVSEVYHPFYNIAGPATEHFQQMDQYIPNFWLIPFVWTGLFEFYSINKGN